MFGSVNKSDEDPKPNLSCASVFVRQSRTFNSITALCAHIFKLAKYSILIPFGSDLDPNRVCKCRERERERETGAGTSK